MLKVIFCFLLRDYERDEGFPSLKTGDSNFSSSMGYTMLRNETVSNKTWGWNITSGFQNFILFILSKECYVPVNHLSTRVHQRLTVICDIASVYFCVCVCMCIWRIFLRAGMEREKCSLSVKLNDNLMNILQHRKALLYVLTIIFPHQHFVNETIKSWMGSSILLACTYIKGSYECQTIILWVVYPTISNRYTQILTSHVDRKAGILQGWPQKHRKNVKAADYLLCICSSWLCLLCVKCLAKDIFQYWIL